MLPAELPQSVIEKLGYYVYLYLDPNSPDPNKKTIFYVGKGQGNRVLSHLWDQAESEKVATIQRLKAAGQQPIIEILAHNLPNEETALRLEAAVIDLLGIKSLTNQVRGWESSIVGRMSLGDLIAQYAPQPVEITEAAILIRINRYYRYGMSPEELQEVTCGIWKVSARREKAQLAFAIYKGIVREVYQIKKWVPAGTIEYKTRLVEKCDRWEFEGETAPEELRHKYLNKSVSRYFSANSQNPITYVNC